MVRERQGESTDSDGIIKRKTPDSRSEVLDLEPDSQILAQDCSKCKPRFNVKLHGMGLIPEIRGVLGCGRVEVER